MVSDTDGSAFITKAEFDSLKNNFQAQIDNYNSSIDSKIDGAIASYLAGVKLSSVIQQNILIPEMASSGVRIFNNNDWINHSPGRPDLNAYILDGYCELPNWRLKALACMTTNPSPGTRAMVNNISYINNTAEWAGVASGVIDQLVIYCDIFKNFGNWTVPQINFVKQNYLQHFALEGVYVTATTSNIIGKSFPVGRIDHSGLRPSPGTLPDSREDLWNQALNTATIFGATQNIGSIAKPFIVTEKGLEYSYFSDYDRPECWLCGNGDIDNYIKYDSTQQTSIGYYNSTQVTVPYWQGYDGPAGSGNLDYRLDITYAAQDSWKDCLFLTLGFIGNTIHSWKNIYDSRLDSVVNDLGGSSAVLIDTSGKKHISVNAGLPILKVKAGSEYSLGLELQGASSEWALWVSNVPFGDDLTSQPYINLTSHSRHADKKNAYILEPSDVIKFTAVTDGLVWLKWRKNITDFDASDTSILLPGASASVITD